MYYTNKSNTSHFRNLIRNQFIFFLILLAGLSFLPPSLVASQTAKGKIAGKLVDAKTGSPLIGANVVIQGTNMGAASDLEGNYLINAVPTGTYTLVVMMMGYSRFTVNDVVVSANQVTKINYL